MVSWTWVRLFNLPLLRFWTVRACIRRHWRRWYWRTTLPAPLFPHTPLYFAYAFAVRCEQTLCGRDSWPFPGQAFAVWRFSPFMQTHMLPTPPRHSSARGTPRNSGPALAVYMARMAAIRAAPTSRCRHAALHFVPLHLSPHLLRFGLKHGWRSVVLTRHGGLTWTPR